MVLFRFITEFIGVIYSPQFRMPVSTSQARFIFCFITLRILVNKRGLLLIHLLPLQGKRFQIAVGQDNTHAPFYNSFELS
jgi:hypothetical protein